MANVSQNPPLRPEWQEPPDFYPEDDKTDWPESSERRKAIESIVLPLEDRYAGCAEVSVEADMLVYFDESNFYDSRKVDVLVALGVPPRVRWSYRIWTEGKYPDFILKVGPWGKYPKTRNAYWNREHYRKLGVPEFFNFDPRYRDPGHEGSLQGWALQGGKYVELGPGGEYGSTEEVTSEVLGVTIRPSKKRLRLKDLHTGEILKWHEELRAAATVEATSRRVAEARVAELEAKLKAVERNR